MMAIRAGDRSSDKPHTFSLTLDDMSRTSRCKYIEFLNPFTTLQRHFLSQYQNAGGTA